MKVVIDDYRLERMDAYTDPLNDKIKRQAAEITRLLKENAQIKDDYELALKVCEDDAKARTEGQEEAWKLARNIAYDGYSNNELKEIFGTICLDEIFDLTYTEAAAKVAEWKKSKEEICVGDVLLSNGISHKCIVTYIRNNTVILLWDDGSCGERCKSAIKGEFEKVGHIDVNTWLAQIGGEE